jgi:hypothetical protein
MNPAMTRTLWSVLPGLERWAPIGRHWADGCEVTQRVLRRLSNMMPITASATAMRRNPDDRAEPTAGTASGPPGGAHCPLVQTCPAGHEGEPQQTAPTQKPEPHWVPVEQDVPFSCLGVGVGVDV